jgi:hypothetical protein
MIKTASSPKKAPAPVRLAKKRQTAAQRFQELPLQERRKRITAFFDDMTEQWKDSPKAEAVDFLLKLRRAE